jgi:hypothetical protein
MPYSDDEASREPEEFIRRGAVARYQDQHGAKDFSRSTDAVDEIRCRKLALVRLDGEVGH